MAEYPATLYCHHFEYSVGDKVKVREGAFNGDDSPYNGKTGVITYTGGVEVTDGWYEVRMDDRKLVLSYLYLYEDEIERADP